MSVTASVVDPAILAKAMPIVVHEGYATKSGGKVRLCAVETAESCFEDDGGD